MVLHEYVFSLCIFLKGLIRQGTGCSKDVRSSKHCGQKDFRRASNCARHSWSVGRRNSLRQLRATCVSRDAALRAISQPELPACFLPWMAGPCTLPWSSMVAVPSWQCCEPCLPVFPNLQVSSASNAKVTEFPKSLRIRQELNKGGITKQAYNQYHLP